MADMLVTASELASYLQQDVDTATATLVIEMATGKVQAAAGQRLVAATSTFLIDVPWGDCGPWLSLPQMPVRSVSSVLIDGVASTDWFLRSQQLWRLDGWSVSSSAPSQVTVAATHGYLVGAQGLQLARDYTLALAGAGYGPMVGGVTSEAIDDYRVTFADADAAMQVTPYMRDHLRATYGTGVHVTSSS
jgi:hypothetical protein